MISFWWAVGAGLIGFIIGVVLWAYLDQIPMPSPYTTLEEKAVQRDLKLLGDVLFEMKEFMSPTEWKRFSDRYYNASRAFERLYRKDTIE